MSVEDDLSVDERLVRITGRAQTYGRWLNNLPNRDDPGMTLLTDELCLRDVPWLLGLVRGLTS